MLGVFKKIIDSGTIFNIQRVQYSEKLFIDDTVGATTTKQQSISISTLGDFYCKFLTGSFSTLIDVAGTITDDGVCHTRMKIIDGSNQKQLTNNFIPLNLFLTPGREKSSLSAATVTDAPGNSLFYPIELEYMFAKSNEIILEVKNDSNTSNTWGVCLHGIRRLPVSTYKKK